jgi:hypothetical protein
MKKVLLLALTALAAVLVIPAALAAQATTPSCSAAAPAGSQYVGTVIVDSASPTPNTLQLQANGTYTAVACGTWMNGLNGQYGSADAAFNSNASWSTTPQQGGDQNGGPEWGKLQINGTTPNWGSAYSASHTYQTQFTGDSASFLINDTPVDSPWFQGWWGDNSGSLTVDVYRVNTNPTSATQCKNNGWKAYGVFKNQGDCVSFVASGAQNLPAKA